MILPSIAPIGAKHYIEEDYCKSEPADLRSGSEHGNLTLQFNPLVVAPSACSMLDNYAGCDILLTTTNLQDLTRTLDPSVDGPDAYFLEDEFRGALLTAIRANCRYLKIIIGRWIATSVWAEYAEGSREYGLAIADLAHRVGISNLALWSLYRGDSVAHLRAHVLYSGTFSEITQRAEDVKEFGRAQRALIAKLRTWSAETGAQITPEEDPDHIDHSVLYGCKDIRLQTGEDLSRTHARASTIEANSEAQIRAHTYELGIAKQHVQRLLRELARLRTERARRALETMVPAMAILNEGSASNSL